MESSTHDVCVQMIAIFSGNACFGTLKPSVHRKTSASNDLLMSSSVSF